MGGDPGKGCRSLMLDGSSSQMLIESEVGTKGVCMMLGRGEEQGVKDSGPATTVLYPQP